LPADGAATVARIAHFLPIFQTGRAAEFKKRTLTNLYNQRPTWLDLAHKKLDAAVFAAYGWDPSMTDEDILAKLLELNLQRAKDAPIE
jgi:hypothetical protein